MDIQAWERMLDQGNDSVMLRYALGSLLFKEGAVEAAAEHLKQGLAQDPDHSASWKLYGKSLAKAGHLKDARRAYEKGIAVAEAHGDIQAVKEMRVFLKRLDRKGDQGA